MFLDSTGMVIPFRHCLHISPLITGIRLHGVASVRRPLAVPCTLIWPLSLRKYCRILKVNYLYFRPYRLNSHLTYLPSRVEYVGQPDDTHIFLHWAASLYTSVTRAYQDATNEWHANDRLGHGQLVLISSFFAMNKILPCLKSIGRGTVCEYDM